MDSITYQSGEWNIECVSKFHDEGIYLHNIDETSDVYTYDDYEFYRYTQGEHYLSINEDNGESGHTFVCAAEKTVNGVLKTCSYTTECDSVFSYTYVNSSYHRIYCPDCYYSEYVDHDLYMYSAAPEDYVVKCYDCNYTVECWESPEYYGNSNEGHWVDCPCGCYSFFEEHKYHFSTQGVGSHYAICEHCYYEAELSHKWVDTGSELECVDCGETISYSQMNSIGDLTDEELAILVTFLPEDKLETLIASFPESDLARVTAILPTDDDVLLTE